MKWIKYVCMMLAVAFVSSCSDEDPINEGKVKAGLAASMNLNVEVPVIEPVEMTRGINDYESEMNELVIVMFSKTGDHRKEIIDLTGKIVSDSYNDIGYREYTLKEDVKTVSGTYTAYAIANFTSPYCGLSMGELSSDDLTEDGLKAMLAKNASQTHLLTGTQCMPMTQVIDNLVIYSDEEVKADNAKKNSLRLTLKRVMAHIEFEFKSADGITFNPYEYTVYNLPDGAYLVDRTGENNLIEGESMAYFNTETCNTDGSTFDFFMLENVQKSGTNITCYEKRDKWDPQQSSDFADRTFTNAPKNSTFVVVRGTYYGPGETSNTTYTGECTYIIHLGGNKDNADFSVNRNEYHKYTVTIKGIKTIYKEAISKTEVDVWGGDVPGAEGFLRQITNSFILDAHYERVRVEIGKINYDNLLNSTEKKDHTILLCTPKTSLRNKVVKIKYNGSSYVVDQTSDEGEDIDWIHFIKPTDKGKVPPYDDKQAGGILDFLNKPDDYCLPEKNESGNLTYYTYAYVDEYFYEDIHPKEFVNVMNRSFVLDPIERGISDDKQSTIIETTVLDISQRSIKSSFDMDKIGAGDLLYGIETWDETGAQEWNIATPSGLLSDQGLVNTKLLLNNNNVSMSDNVWAYIGYRNSVNDNTKRRHRWYDDEHYQKYKNGEYTDDDINEYTNSNIQNPLLAVLARNRVKLDSSGKIDESSVKWYLPGINQYMIIWLGQNRLQEDTRLMDVSKLTQFVPAGGDYDKNPMNMDRQQHYLTSSLDTKRLYWQDQGACWSGISDLTNNWNAVYTGTEFKNYNKIRCMRNLRNQYLDNLYSAQDNLTENSPVQFPVKRDGRVFHLGAIANSRLTYMTGGYNAHTEREPENYLYSDFEVADPSKAQWAYGTNDYYCCTIEGKEPKDREEMKDYIQSMNALAAQYTQSEDKSDLGEWRVPNQRELMIIAVMDTDPNNYILPKGTYTRYAVMTSTYFTGWSNTGRKIPFFYDSGTPYGSDYNMTLPDNYGNCQAVLLFVRDVK